MTEKHKNRRARNLDGKRKKLMRKRGLYFDQDLKRYLKEKFGEFESVGVFPEVVERTIYKNFISYNETGITFMKGEPL